MEKTIHTEKNTLLGQTGHIHKEARHLKSSSETNHHHQNIKIVINRYFQSR